MFPVSDVIPSRTVPVVTVGLIAINALVFLYQVSLGPADLRMFMTSYAVIPAWFWWPSLVTSQFLHGGHYIEVTLRVGLGGWQHASLTRMADEKQTSQRHGDDHDGSGETQKYPCGQGEF